jgi:hypothetical protein
VDNDHTILDVVIDKALLNSKVLHSCMHGRHTAACGQGPEWTDCHSRWW